MVTTVLLDPTVATSQPDVGPIVCFFVELEGPAAAVRDADL